MSQMCNPLDNNLSINPSIRYDESWTWRRKKNLPFDSIVLYSIGCLVSLTATRSIKLFPCPFLTWPAGQV